MLPARSSSNSSAGFTLVEVIIAMGLLTAVSLGVAQLFAASTRANLAARTRTSTTAMAEQKMEQIRSLTWGFDTAGQGLPISDTTTNLTVYPMTPTGSGLNPSPADALEQNRAGGRLHRCRPIRTTRSSSRCS
jgi:prepilin-type N-terminal cleavage/methylation domain-containing protein